MEPVRSWKITLRCGKNKSRSHFNTYSKGLSAMCNWRRIYETSQKTKVGQGGGYYISK
jgi:hypothetical protein